MSVPDGSCIVARGAQDGADVYLEGGAPGDDRSTSREAIFTGRIYVYDENVIAADNLEYINAHSKELGHSVKIRGPTYAIERSAWEHPIAFISHDSRDKDVIAKPLALSLQALGCPVWYDEFSLNVGDSLRGSIEKGLKECRKCIFVITPHFLANGGWGKREYDSIFTRELIERENVVLPVWHGVTPADVYAYSPVLADRVAVPWSTADEVAKRLAAVVRA